MFENNGIAIIVAPEVSRMLCLHCLATASRAAPVFEYLTNMALLCLAISEFIFATADAPKQDSIGSSRPQIFCDGVCRDMVSS